MSDTPAVRITSLSAADREWANALITERWGGTQMITRGQAHECSVLPGFVAWRGTQRIGLLTYHITAPACEVVSLDSLVEWYGVGSVLLAAVEDAARAAGCTRVWLITTNDNLHALGFYQRRGYRLAALYPGAVDAARALKPQIPALGFDNIPLYDEIELQKQV